MRDDDGEIDQIVEEVLNRLSTVEDPWTTRGAVRGKVRERDGISHEQSKDIASRLESFDSVYLWFGYIVRREVDVIRAAIEEESDGEFSRKILIGQLNDELQEVGHAE